MTLIARSFITRIKKYFLNDKVQIFIFFTIELNGKESAIILQEKSSNYKNICIFLHLVNYEENFNRIP
jgi:hypothetical protein